MAKAILRKNNPVIARFTEIGRCYKGSPEGTSKKGGNYKGGDDYNSPYIRFEPADRFKFQPATSDRFPNLYDELKAKWEEVIAEGRIFIRFPYADVASNFDWTNKIVKAIGNTTKTFRECDGTTCTKWVESAPHPSKPGQTIPKFVRGEKACSAIEGKECPEGCQAKGMLKFIAPDFYPGGIILFPLNSPVDISAIEGYLQPFRNISDISAIPFSLFRKPDPVSWEEKGEIKTKSQNWGLHLEVDPQMSMLMMESRQRRFIGELKGEPQVAALPSARLAIAPAANDELPQFRNSEDGFGFKMQVAAAIRSGSLTELEQAIEDAELLIHSGLYDFRSGMEFIDREAERAREALRDRGGVAVQYLTEDEAKSLWSKASSAGFTAESARKCLDSLGIKSFAEIPKSRESEVTQKLTNPEFAKQYA